ncbi:hypothetical protein OUZ56_002533 [Daphnia magna]|uniref:Transmembrane protein n=1 Tax=Daphnia magna TaxID=35525 RepID=A0ABR0A5Z6_9CRUS|nr:hypothetical protein OUZ56_002533 [Daphnia magna]
MFLRYNTAVLTISVASPPVDHTQLHFFRLHLRLVVFAFISVSSTSPSSPSRRLVVFFISVSSTSPSSPSRRLRLHLRLVVSSSSPSSPSRRLVVFAFISVSSSRRLRLHLRLVVFAVFVFVIISSPASPPPFT